MTLVGHALSGIAAYGVFRGRTGPWGLSTKTIVWVCLILPVLPDLDVIAHAWVTYGEPLGHRGIFHSFTVAALVGLATALLLRATGKIVRERRALLGATLLCASLVASHPLTDAMTTGGKALMLFWPLSSERVFLPWRVIPVSPFGSHLLRTQWRPEELRRAERSRRGMLRDRRATHAVVRAMVGLSDRADHSARLRLAGIIATEALYMAPLWLIALLRSFVDWRRRPRRAPGTSARAPPVVWPALRVPGILVPAVVAVASLLALCVALGAGLSFDSRIQIDAGHSRDAYRTPWLRARPTGGDRGPVAILLHGWRCSHQLMMPMARMLARNGVTAYALDLPGHATSPVALDMSCRETAPRPCRVFNDSTFVREANVVLSALVREQNLGNRDVIVVGHSSGASAANGLLGAAADRLAGRIVLEGGVPRPLRTGNTLHVARTRFFDRKYPRWPRDVLQGSFEDRTASMLAVQEVKHLDMIRHAPTNRAILDWIRRASGGEVGHDARHHYTLYRWATVLAALFGLAAINFLLVLLRRRGLLEPQEPLSSPRPGVGLAFLVVGSLAAAFVCGEVVREGVPWLWAAMRMTAPTYLMCASLCVGIPYAIVAFRPRRPPWQPLARDVAVGAAVFVMVYATVGLVADAYMFQTSLVAARWPRLLVWALAFLPVALVVREVGPRGGSLGRETIRAALRIVLWTAVLYVHAVGRRPVDRSEVMGVAAICAAAEAFAFFAAGYTRSRLAGAVTVSLCVSWFLTAAYPFVTSATLD